MNINQTISTGREHFTSVEGQKLFLWEKPRTGAPARGTILFVHGSSMASTPGFDLQAPGYVSAMDFFAAQGFDCWCCDHRGYGRSYKGPELLATIAQGADDLAAASQYIMGMLVMADPSFTAIQLVVVATLSQKLGWQFYEALRRNDIMIVQSHEQIYDTVKRGERLMAAESSDPRIYTGGELPPNMISVIPHDGAIQVPSPTAIVKGSPHPNAAKLFAQFNLTPEIQHKFTEEGHHSPRVDIPPPPGLPRLDELTLYPADYDFIEKNTKQIKAKFADIFQ